MPSFLGPFTDDEIISELEVKNVRYIDAQIDFSTPSGTYNLGEILPVGTRVLFIFIQILSTFDGSPAITVGDTINSTKYIENETSDLTELGIYSQLILDQIELISQGRIYWNPGGSTAGSLKVVAVIAEP
ncbi:hypothetical protein [Leptospira andrefontaineae]|uniref:Uncharacterized protein n=1 Tax=Leptospira andrefontaineae TaxID=2484976 RepID=A0A4R9H6K8_9LEPT|nr:hypothetical protein [Leptospira andrefontaineae]TGK41230.1 hypothetical protein EHO65_07305 [Leptospira andrefontaineae]